MLRVARDIQKFAKQAGCACFRSRWKIIWHLKACTWNFQYQGKWLNIYLDDMCTATFIYWWRIVYYRRMIVYCSLVHDGFDGAPLCFGLNNPFQDVDQANSYRCNLICLSGGVDVGTCGSMKSSTNSFSRISTAFRPLHHIVHFLIVNKSAYCVISQMCQQSLRFLRHSRQTPQSSIYKNLISKIPNKLWTSSLLHSRASVLFFSYAVTGAWCGLTKIDHST